jgi:hypothetical protein
MYFRLITSSEAQWAGRVVLERLACIHTHFWCGNLLKDRNVEPVFYDGQIKDDTMNSTYVNYVILTAKPLGSLIRRSNNSVKMEVRRFCVSEPNGHGCGRHQATGFTLADISLCWHYHKWSLEFMPIFVCS